MRFRAGGARKSYVSKGGPDALIQLGTMELIQGNHHSSYRSRHLPAVLVANYQ